MKKLSLVLSVFFFTYALNARVVTSVSSGNFSNPSVWDCSCVPLDGDTIEIVNGIMLDLDYAFTMGGIHIDVNGSLTGNANNRIFGVSGGYFYNEGTAMIAYVFHNGGNSHNQGLITATRNLLIDQSVTLVNNYQLFVNDTLLIGAQASLQNGFGYVSCQEIQSAGAITNYGNLGYIVCYNLVNTGTVSDNGGGIHALMNIYNSGVMVLYGFEHVDGSLYSTGDIAIGSYLQTGSLYNGDSTSGIATFSNNGTVSISNSLYNTETINGTGDFCIADSSINSGNITGFVDICDQTGGGWDLNVGTEAGTVTHCAAGPCSIGIAEFPAMSMIMVPNPAHELVNIAFSEAQNGIVRVTDITGRVVMVQRVSGNGVVLNVLELPIGIYSVTVTTTEEVFTGMFMKE